ncbi:MULTISPECIES: FecCD family ABC transporter permease [Arcobacteraceae]|uniref:ABC transporter permease protein n=2 Tax=Aliarcobacter thereius TaxID=544718 RepID=A0A1C7WMM4_9BACT|nr:MULTISPECIES: iron ABC transporter permease [Arcobacteraceae]OCL85333.1 putative ABC transporter permease protein [Arcobacter porcinus]OCL91886.1 putative ABC transporter permease protein [Aliarcobacter thereius]OCL95016.1 putative ABC transporter permease protein [Aliarcobacter thereius LMG 24486]OCM00464.1 putative ABC transporter permease protein [Aliarcobacter thereius]QBF15113.1 iron siderophore ABC transporter, permease protein [Aliarcobacter thereius LMG 24486]
MIKSGYFVLALALIIIINASLFLGQYEISLNEYFMFIQKLLGFNSSISIEKYETMKSIIFDIRLPRIISAVLIGASLAVAGASFQAMFVNPLVSPGILGVLSGASFGAALGMILGLNWFLINLSTFIFGILAVFFAITISFIYSSSRNMIILVLGGIISSSLFSALLSIIKYGADTNDVLPAITYWLMGSLSFSTSSIVWNLTIPMLGGILILIFFSKYLNALSLGDEEAKALGVNTKLIKLIIIIVATLISALSVILAGIIGWIGLIIPHITRLIFGADNKVILPMSALIGAIFLLIVDNTSKLIFSFEIPIGIVTAIIGIPIFIFVLKNAKKGF